MRTRLILISLIWTTCCIAETPSENFIQQGGKLIEPTIVFATLLKSGNLPGISKDQHGEFSTAFEPPDAKPTYPMTVKVTLTIKNEERRFYTVRKEEEGELWLITDSWTTSSNGQRHDLLLPSEESQIEANMNPKNPCTEVSVP